MARASEDSLAEIHKMVADGIKQLVQSDDPGEHERGLAMAMRFLKDNSITATPRNDGIASLKETIKAKLPTAEELDRLMHLSPADLGPSA
jgi:hypothetical protein